MRKATIAILVTVALALASAPALGLEAGASGQCYDSSGNGGEDAASVNTDAGVTQPAVTDGGAADAVTTFAQGTAANPGGDACTEADDDDNGKDYVEVHAGDAQACYDQSFRTDGGCPTHYSDDDTAE